MNAPRGVRCSLPARLAVAIEMGHSRLSDDRSDRRKRVRSSIQYTSCRCVSVDAGGLAVRRRGEPLQSVRAGSSLHEQRATSTTIGTEVVIGFVIEVHQSSAGGIGPMPMSSKGGIASCDAGALESAVLAVGVIEGKTGTGARRSA